MNYLDEERTRYGEEGTSLARAIARVREVALRTRLPGESEEDSFLRVLAGARDRRPDRLLARIVSERRPTAALGLLDDETFRAFLHYYFERCG